MPSGRRPKPYIVDVDYSPLRGRRRVLKDDYKLLKAMKIRDPFEVLQRDYDILPLVGHSANIEVAALIHRVFQFDLEDRGIAHLRIAPHSKRQAVEF